MAFVDVGTTRLFYESVGEGEPLVLVNFAERQVECCSRGSSLKEEGELIDPRQVHSGQLEGRLAVVVASA